MKGRFKKIPWVVLLAFVVGIALLVWANGSGREVIRREMA